MATLRCVMRSGHALHHPRTGLLIPGELGDVICAKWQLEELKADSRVVIEGFDRGIPDGVPRATVEANRKKSRNRVSPSPKKTDELKPDRPASDDDTPRRRSE